MHAGIGVMHKIVHPEPKGQLQELVASGVSHSQPWTFHPRGRAKRKSPGLRSGVQSASRQLAFSEDPPPPRIVPSNSFAHNRPNDWAGTSRIG
jgi:hypothetical protein